MYSQYAFFVLMPCLNDYVSVGRLLEDLNTKYQGLYYAIIVDDGSDKTDIAVNVFKEHGVHGEILILKRNVGHQYAIFTGLNYLSSIISKHQSVVIMDSDGEDDPSYIEQLLDLKQYDLTLAKRSKRSENLLFIFFYTIYKCVFRLLTGVTISWGNFMCLSADAVRRLSAMPEAGINLASSVLLSRLHYKLVDTVRTVRYDGISKMSFTGLLLHGISSIMNLSKIVYTRIIIFCALIAAACIAAMLTVCILKILNMTLYGWTSSIMLILIVILMGAVNIFLLAVFQISLANRHSMQMSASDDLVATKITE